MIFVVFSCYFYNIYFIKEKIEDICWLAIYIDCLQCITFIVLSYKYIYWITDRDYYSIWKFFCSFLQLYL